ncbi:MAG: aminotransferase class V-fold PLP-dependent enzyme, partial [Actinomycetota bacterium]|nr:aminotransferase class V-fold PLP-dependent enzyme [Actinomycetota bacterium]
VDAIQAVGCLDVRPALLGVTVLSAGVYKWLCSPHGLAITYVNRQAIDEFDPASAWWGNVRPGNYADWGAYIQTMLQPGAMPAPLTLDFAEGAKRFEASPSYLALHALEATVDLLLRVGIAEVQTRVFELTDYLRARVTDVGVDVLSSWEPGERSGIVSIDVPDARSFAMFCEQRGIFVLPQRRVATAEEKVRREPSTSRMGVQAAWDPLHDAGSSAIRVSPHVYNSEGDIDVLAEALSTYLPRSAPTP